MADESNEEWARAKAARHVNEHGGQAEMVGPGLALVDILLEAIARGHRQGAEGMRERAAGVAESFPSPLGTRIYEVVATGALSTAPETTHPERGKPPRPDQVRPTVTGDDDS